MMFNRAPAEPSSEALERLNRRIDELETRCETLSQALTGRDEVLKQLELSQLVTGKRLDEAMAQFRQTATGLFDRIEAVRNRARSAEGVPAAAEGEGVARASPAALTRIDP